MAKMADFIKTQKSFFPIGLEAGTLNGLTITQRRGNPKDMIYPDDHYGLMKRLVARFTEPIDYLEVGVCEGMSMNCVLENARVRFAVGVDNWCYLNGGVAQVTKTVGDRMDRVLLIGGDSHDILPRLSHKFDLIYVDGDHSEEGAVRDMDDCLRLLKPKGIMLIDDLDHPAHRYLRGAAERWAVVNKLIITVHNIGLGVGEVWRE